MNLLPVSGQVARCTELASTARDRTLKLNVTMSSAPDVIAIVIGPQLFITMEIKNQICYQMHAPVLF